MERKPTNFPYRVCKTKIQNVSLIKITLYKTSLGSTENTMIDDSVTAKNIYVELNPKKRLIFLIIITV